MCNNIKDRGSAPGKHVMIPLLLEDLHSVKGSKQVEREADQYVYVMLWLRMQPALRPTSL